MTFWFLLITFMAVSAAGQVKMDSSMPKTSVELYKQGKQGLSLDWSSEMEAKSIQDEFTRSDLFWLYLNADAQYRVNPYVWFHIDGYVRTGSESTQSLFEKEDEGNGVLLNQATVNLKPFKRLTLSAGALDQRELEAPLLVGERSFLGAKEKLRILNFSAFKVDLMAQQTVPSSRTFSSENAELEETPYFLTESLIAELKPAHSTKLTGRVTHFQYKSLPGAIALKSDQYGNSVSELQGRFSRFDYGFSGIHTNFKISQKIVNALEVSGGLSYLENFEAPEDRNKGQLAFGEVTARLGQLSIQPRFEYFVNQSDSAPAYYNNEDYGHNNRVGENYQLGFYLHEYNLKVIGNYLNTRAINRDPQEPDQSYYSVRIQLDL